jgi:hypothetical protein
MSTSLRPLPVRCQETRQRLVDFAANRLGPTATGEVQAHLLSCQSCSEAFGDLLMEEVESGDVPLLTPPQIPPVEWYDAYMRVGSGRFGTFWKSIRDAQFAAGEELGEWAQKKLDEIAQALNALAPPAPLPIRVRGAVRTRGAVTRTPQPLAGITAAVVSAEGDPTGVEIHFKVTEPARVTDDGHFSLTLSTDDDRHDDRLVICTLALPGATSVSFAGSVARRADERSREVRIDEAGVPGPGRDIPAKHLSVAVLGA